MLVRAPVLLAVLSSHRAIRRSPAIEALADVKPPSVAECLEASFVPAVMGVSSGDVTELKLFIAAAQAGHRTEQPLDVLSAAMDALPVQSAGRPLAPAESALRSQWIALVYLTLDRLATEAGGDPSKALVPSETRAECEALVATVVTAKREQTPVSSIQLNQVSTGSATLSETETALLQYAMRVTDLTLDNVEAEEQAGSRADASSQSASPPQPFIPGTGGTA
jgi:hypothetical protein